MSEPSPPDSLLAAARQGDDLAAAAFDRTWRPRLLRFALGYLRDPHDCEDAAQSILTRVLTDRTDPDNLETWILRVARNHCLNLRRSRQRRRDAGTLPPASAVAGTATGFLTRLVQGERVEALERAFASLPDGEQEALRLRYGEGLSRGEIAAIAEVPESTVKSRLFEGLRKLRETLDRAD